MPVKWKGTKFQGVRYYEHPTRKYGVRFDRYFSIRYQANGKRLEEGLGWSSESITEKKAALALAALKEAARMGEGPKRLREKRKAEEERRKAEEEAQQEEERAARTFADYAEKVYFPWADENKRQNTLRSEKMLFRLWLNPAIGSIPMVRVAEIHLERLKRNMAGKGRAPKTINLALALVRQIFNHAKKRQDYAGDNPVSRIKKPLVDNAKLRYLTPAEIDALLNALGEKSEVVRDQALLAVNTGMRFSEVAGLTWQDVNFETRTLSIRDSKTGSRTAFMNELVADMLHRRQKEDRGMWVFPDEKGARQVAVSKTFQRVADALFNQDVKDRRLRVTFHTLRHSFGSLLYQQTGDIYLTGKALGHRTMVMAMRYAKQSETKLRAAFEAMGVIVEEAKAAKADVVELRK